MEKVLRFGGAALEKRRSEGADVIARFRRGSSGNESSAGDASALKLPQKVEDTLTKVGLEVAGVLVGCSQV